MTCKSRSFFATYFLFITLYLCHFTRAGIWTPNGGINTVFRQDVSSNRVLKIKERKSETKKTAFPNQPTKEHIGTENVAHGFEDHEVVVPIRIHHVTGHPVSHGRHFRKRRRNTDDHPKKRRRRDLRAEEKLHFFRDALRSSRHKNSSHDVREGTYYDVIPDKYSGDSLDFIDRTIEDEYQNHKVANYSVTAFGETFLFHLTPFEDFLAPNYTLHFMGNPEKDSQLHPDVPRHCFYSGFVNGREDHRAVVSVCRGLFGAFRTATMDYLIQPEVMSSNFDDDDDDEGTKPHRIFRRSTRAAGSKGRQLCGYVEPKKEPMDRRWKDSELHFDDKVLEDLQKLSNPNEATKQTAESRFKSRRKLQAHLRIQRRKISELRHQLVSSSPYMDIDVSKKILQKLKNASSFKYSDLFYPSLSTVGTSSKYLDSSSSKQNEEKVLKRRKRYLSYARNVEVMVTADNAMFEAHDDVEHYVLTLMAIVNHVYHDPSIENQINIILVKLIVIGDSQIQNGPRVVRDAHSCLRNFCDWQFRQNDPDDSHPGHYDTAVLITGQDICRSETACDTLGLAELGTMCDLRRSCSINEDNGLSTAFTIAHEIGHEFNAPHDNNDKCLDTSGRSNRVELNVMSPTLDNNAHPWSWSRCSAKYVTSFLDNGHGRCLLDEPPQRVLPLPVEEPGEVFDANAQCSFVYGKGVNHCNFMFRNTCRRLWCVSQNTSHGCRTPHVPWADGTRCGNGMWCQRGQCVPENRHRIPVDGSWGEWSKFGNCSQPCGGGVKSAVRECNNPKPQYGGRFCTGKRKKFKPCNYQECAVGTDFRAQQCAEYNDWSRHSHHRIRGISPTAEWIPKYDGILAQDRCKLICQVKSRDQYAVPWYVLRPKVTNGTPCGPDTTDMCVEGVCEPAGCDHVLNSRTKEDSCGVCNGDNSGCKLVQGSYNSGYNIGYNEVVVIPAGANNIVITQRSYTGNAEDNNYLAVRDTRGNYILNGNRSVMKSKHRMHRRSRGRERNYLYYCDYSGTDYTVEKINCSKAIQMDIVIEVLSAGDLMPPNIGYRYNVPVENTITYRWDPNGPWGPCSKTCDGRKKGKMLCVRSDDQLVHERRCSHLPKPSPIIKPCNVDCQFKWHPKPAKCTVRCGSEVVNLEYECRKVTKTYHQDGSPGEREVEEAEDHLCPDEKPNGVTTCEGECLPTRWVYGRWSECSRTCGGGRQTRRAVCRDSRSIVLDPSECAESRRVATRVCSSVACPQWVTSAFSQCTATCGNGVRERRVWCGSSEEVLPDTKCDTEPKPSSSVACKVRDCARWKYNGWGPCTATCGKGSSSRLYSCVDFDGRTTDNSHCDTSVLRQDLTRVCFASRDCYRRRSRNFDNSLVWQGLVQQDPVVDTTTSTEPTTTTSKTTPEQPAVSNHNSGSNTLLINFRRDLPRWRTGSWTQCSATCGPGLRRRYVSCRDRNGREVSDEECGPADRTPAAREKCELRPCQDQGQWRIGMWSRCSVTCGRGMRSRYVGCLYAGRYHSSGEHCVNAAKPVERESCVAPTQCTTTTKATTTTTTTTLPTTTTRPPTRSPAAEVQRNRWSPSDVVQPRSSVTSRKNDVTLVQQRSHWRTGPWSQCSVTCGRGTKRRAVVCQSATRRSAVCLGERPSNTQACNTSPCPRWRHGRWGKCSQSCNGGTRSRRVYCAMSDGRATYDQRCEVRSRPIASGACGLRPCTGGHRWRKEAWGSCSATCGRGFKTRSVQCVNRSDRAVADVNCAHVRRAKPKTTRRCAKQRKCPKWRTGKWNQCSATCGAGMQVRRVNCRYKRKVIVDKLCDTSSRPDDVKKCNVTRCSTYHWFIEPWTPCSASCGEGIQTRRVTCRSVGDDRVANAAICVDQVAEDRPVSLRKCATGPCTASWKIGPWSECSLTCGQGIQRREVRCSYVSPNNYTEIDVSSCDVTNKPYDVRDCDRGGCDSRVYWRVGPWSDCSTSCGEGTSVRRVVCSERNTQAALHDGVCQAMPSFRPDRTRACRNNPCVPVSCRHLKVQQSVTKDGEYFLKVQGKMAKIYCKGMNTPHPLEYLTLVKGEEENYSEIFGFRLINADTCPMNGSRDPNCACHRDHPDEGYTAFRKVRFDVTRMRVLANDFSFARTRFGKPVPFGAAGDCYSRSNCPQGVFRINFKGTGFAVSTDTRWRSYGIDSVRRIHRSHAGDTIAGMCGGYCSRCQPDPLTGLSLFHNDR